jgi:type II secretory pathway pseudopilin PulG
MQIRLTTHLKQHGSTLVEVMVTLVTLGMLAVSVAGTLRLTRLSAANLEERAVLQQFGLRYAESIKALAFREIKPGYLLNRLYDGEQLPAIRLPKPGEVIDLTSPDYLLFHPALQALVNQRPSLQVEYTHQEHTVEVQIFLSWQPRFASSQTNHLHFALFRSIEL